MIADTPVHATIVHDSMHSGGLMKIGIIAIERPL